MKRIRILLLGAGTILLIGIMVAGSFTTEDALLVYPSDDNIHPATCTNAPELCTTLPARITRTPLTATLNPVAVPLPTAPPPTHP